MRRERAICGEKTRESERAIVEEETGKVERAIGEEETTNRERAKNWGGNQVRGASQNG
jgi:hypothetical protein